MFRVELTDDCIKPCTEILECSNVKTLYKCALQRIRVLSEYNTIALNSNVPRLVEALNNKGVSKC